MDSTGPQAMPISVRKMYRYVVEPVQQVPFPTDQLRQENAWPTSSDDAIKLQVSCESPLDYARVFGADAQIELDSHLEPDAARWASFGWGLVKVQVIPL